MESSIRAGRKIPKSTCAPKGDSVGTFENGTGGMSFHLDWRHLRKDFESSRQASEPPVIQRLIASKYWPLRLSIERDSELEEEERTLETTLTRVSVEQTFKEIHDWLVGVYNRFYPRLQFENNTRFFRDRTVSSIPHRKRGSNGKIRIYWFCVYICSVRQGGKGGPPLLLMYKRSHLYFRNCEGLA